MSSHTHERRIEAALAGAAQPAAAHVFTALFADEAIAAARAADEGRQRGPLAGLPVSVKDLFDIAGRTTLAGSVQRRGAPAAAADAVAVQRLRAAGAAIVGLTNMSEFAFSGVGLNPHHGTPRNPADGQTARIPGGSSAGAAVSVALGLCFAGLGSDTGGSIRVPAALCGLVGFKNTRQRTPLQGAFPLSFTLDTACALAKAVTDCLLVDGVLAGAPLQPTSRDVRGLRLAVPQTVMLDGLQPAVAGAFQDALARLSAAGALLTELPLAELAEVTQINAPGETIRKKIGHDYLLMPGVAALIFNDANEVLLGRRTDNGRWAVIGGAVDPGETPADAIIREVREEVGVDITIERIVGVYTTPVITYPNGDVAQYVSTSFRCRIRSGTPHVADAESTAVQFFALNALPVDLTDSHRQRILDAAEPGTHQPAKFV